MTKRDDTPQSGRPPHWCDGIETFSGAREYTPEALAAVSIAISLKRIADVLEGSDPKKLTIFERILDRIPGHD